MKPFRIAVLQSGSARQTYLPGAVLDDLLAVAEVSSNAHGDRELTVEERHELIRSADVIITGWGGSRLEEADYQVADRLKMVALIGSSIKGLCPEAAWERGVTITHTARAIGQSVAEFTVGAMLCWAHQYLTFDHALKSGEDWSSAKTRHVQQDLADLTVGLVGCGAVGAEVARILKTLAARVVIYDPFASPAYLAEHQLESTDDLPALIRCSDILSLHAGYTDATHHLIGAQELATMRPGSLLVNTSRGGLVDEHALVDALQAGRIWAALDVFEDEPLPPDHPLRRSPRVMLSPHIAGFSNRSVYRRCAVTLVEDVLRFLQGRQPLNTVTPVMFARMT
ncbi:MAG: hydroxyacid dehydrogenase [Phycisphaerales bacterium]